MTEVVKQVPWELVEEGVERLLAQIQHARVDIRTIVAVTKGGIIPAGLIHQAFPDATFVCLKCRSYTERHRGVSVDVEPPQKWMDQPTTLVVDEICDSGETFKAIQRKLPSVMFASLYTRDGSSFQPRFNGLVAQKGKWLIFPWEDFAPPPQVRHEIPENNSQA